jgi:hypothetical protein
MPISARTLQAVSAGLTACLSLSLNLIPSYSFAHNGGAIAGLVIGGLISILFAVIWLSLARRRKRNAILNDFPEVDPDAIADEPWGPPLEDGDVDHDDNNNDINITEDDTAVMTEHYHRVLTSFAHDQQPDVDEGGVEPGIGPRRGSFGQQTQMTGFGQASDTMALGVLMGSGDGKVSPQSRRTPSTTPSTPAVLNASRSSSSPEHLWAAAGNDPLVPGSPSRYDQSSPITSTSQHHPTRSSVSLSTYPYHSYSRGSGAATSSAFGGGGGATKRSNSVQFLSPPTSFSPTYKAGGSNLGSSSRSPSLKSFMGGLLRRNRNSAPADIGLSTSYTDWQQQQRSPSSVVSGTTTIRAPSPLILTPPSSSILRMSARSRGAIPDWSNRRPSFSIGDEMLSAPPPPPPEVPTARSSMATDELRIGEGLLDPRLRSLVQDSTASLGDHKDYSRPISGVSCFCFFVL